jgi:2-iminoacetate synthase
MSTSVPIRNVAARADFVDSAQLRTLLQQAPTDRSAVREALARARELRGLGPVEAATLLRCTDPELQDDLLAAAREIKDAIYGRRIVLFAPLYYSNLCVNNCLYCGFRCEHSQARRRLSADEVAAETRVLLAQGHKRLLVIGGEEPGPAGLAHLLEVIETVYSTRAPGVRGGIRRVNVESAPFDVDGFRRLREAQIGTYVLFQETYDRETYRRVHPSGPKADYDGRLAAMDRAMTAGLGDVGIGALFGLHDHREEVLGLLVHARHLERTYGAGPHTISVPRLEPAAGAPLASSPPCPVGDAEFKRLVAILRLAVPYTGIIMSTRESAALRGELLDVGISQMSAGSCTEPGGYRHHADEPSVAQFAVGDQRPLDAVIADIAARGYIPSFCTGCYRKGRVGQDFMDLAKPGLIRAHCLPNALFTFAEYLHDFASPATRELGERTIADQLAREVPASRQPGTRDALARIAAGERDIYF